jgi:integrase
MAWIVKSGRWWRVCWREHGRVRFVGGFPSAREALARVSTAESSWPDDSPESVVTAGSWAREWLSGLDMSESAVQSFEGVCRWQIEPRWGGVPLGEVSSAAVEEWVRELRCAGYEQGTVRTMRDVLSRMLDDAVDKGVIEVNPVRRRGQRAVEGWRELVWASPQEVLEIAANAAAVSTVGDGLMILMAAWTGLRWNELAGLQRSHVHLDDGRVLVGAELSVLHESAHRVWLGSPMTSASVRWVSLPPFLVEMLRQHLAGHEARMVFPNAAGTWQRRAAFSRRVMRPAADGIGDAAVGRAARVRLSAVKPGLRFHGLRQSHKMWLVEDGVPEVVQARRLGYALRVPAGPVSLAGQGADQLMVDRLQARFVLATEGIPGPFSSVLTELLGHSRRRLGDAA